LPYIFSEELKSKCITVSTDKLAFLYFLLRVNGKFKTTDLVQIAKNLNHQRYLNLSEQIIKNSSYQELLDLAYEKYIY
jgi:hypothetical protein